MQRREFLGTLAAAGLATALPAGGQEARIQRNGRIKQGLWRNNFGEATTLTFDDMCREAARLGADGWFFKGREIGRPLPRPGLEPLLVGTGGVDFDNGIIHPE